MSKLTQLDARKIHEKLAEGWTEEDFFKYLNCTKEEFWKFLGKKFNPKALRDWNAKFEQNSKKRKMKKKSSKETSEIVNKEQIKEEIEMVITECSTEESSYEEAEQFETVEKTESVIDEVEFFDNEMQISQGDANVNIKSEVVESTEDVINSLRQKELQIANELTEKNNAYKSLNLCQTTLKDKLSKHKQRLECLKNELVKEKEAVESVILEFKNISGQLSFLTDDITNKENELYNVRKEIRALEKITIFVYDNGKIEVENEEPDVPTEWIVFYRKAIDFESEYIEELNLKQLKQLSKLITFCMRLKTEDRIFEVSFENDEMEKAFNELM